MGNVEIGTASPTNKLEVAGSIKSTTGGFIFPDGTTQTTAAAGGSSQLTASGSNVYFSSGNVGIGTTAPTYALDVAGTIHSGTGGVVFPDSTTQTSAAIITRWANAGASTIGATTTAPSKGTNSTDQVSWRRVGDTMEMRWRYVQSATGTAGSGNYLLTIPGGYSIDTSKLPVPNSAIDYRAGVGTIKFSYASGAGVCVGPVYAYNSTQLFAELECYNGGTGDGMWGGGYIHFALTAQQAITLEASFPVNGW